MQTFLLLAVALNINLFVHSTPQFFGQSFSSSSVVNPNGQVVSQSVYVDSEGNRVVNGMKVPAQAPFLSPIDALIPPPLPGFIYNQQQYQPQLATSAPARKPATQAPTKKPVTSAPYKKPVTTSAPVKKPLTTTAPAKKPITAKPYRPVTSRPAFTKSPLGNNGYPTDGSYVHDNSGAYIPDRRGQYRGN